MDGKTKQKIRERLDKIWELPNLYSFFETFSKRPAHLVKKGTILFNQGDLLKNLYFVKDGFIKLYQLSREGRETIIYLTGPGNMLGMRALMSENILARHYAETIVDSYIYTMTRDEYMEILTEHPEFFVDLIHVFVDRLNHAEQRIEGFIASDASARVATFLVDCSKRFEKKGKGPIELPLPLTHQRIAEFVGSFRETITHALTKLEKEGIIKVDRSKITILDFEKLQKYSGINAQQ